MLSLIFYFVTLSLFMSFWFHWSFFLMLTMFLCPLMIFYNFSGFFMSKNMYISFDLYSLQMLILTVLIICFCLLSSTKLFSGYTNNLFLLNFFLLTLFLFLFFVLNSLMLFFFFFESTLLPTLFLVLGWGNKIERIQSGFYFFFYTLFGSMPMMMGIFLVMNSNLTLSFTFFENSSLMLIFNMVLVFSFLIKMPMFLVHSWLPKAHVEAPVSGSMILAGVLLKMGGYGIFRLMSIFKLFSNFNYIWICISAWGGILSSMICFRQVDLKSLVAYSSVSHMSIIIMGFFTHSKLGVFSCFMLMIAHGLCSSGLFYLINVVYERSGTRSIFLNKGLQSIFPSLSFWWFTLCAFNMACPPSLNLLSEIFLISCCFSWSFNLIYMMMILCFLSAMYNLFFYTFCNHGYINSNLNYFNTCYILEYLNLFLHAFPVCTFFLKLEFFS